MRRLLAGLLCALLLPLCALAEEPARDITAECRVSMPGNKDNLPRLRDRDQTTAASANAYRDPYLTITPGETPLAAVFVEQGRACMPFDVQVQQNGEWTTIASSPEENRAQRYVSFPPQSGAVRLQFYSGGVARTLVVRELYAFSEGARGEEVPLWQAPLEKADLLFIATHPDDELLWFGGAIPTYAGARGCAVEVVYATCYPEYRMLELLNGLWHCGVRHYPVAGEFEDFRVYDAASVYAVWTRGATDAFFVRQIRRFRPEVIVTQDPQGEYGHGEHIAVSESVQRAVTLAADPAYDAESAAEFGVWQAKKLYVHLGSAPTLQMDWSQPLDCFGGKTSLTVAQEAFTFHRSQDQTSYAVAGPGEENDSTLYTLVFSTVGEDEQGGDFLEHIPQDGGQE